MDLMEVITELQGEMLKGTGGNVKCLKKGEKS